MDWDDYFGVDIFDIFGGVGNFGPRSGNWYTEDFGVL